MEGWGLVALALIVLAYAGLSRRLSRTPITAALFFVAAGLVVGTEVLDLVELSASSATILHLAEATLALVLFADASRIDVVALRRELAVPARLLGIGLPLSIAAGALAAVILDLSVWEALILAIALAPTDAALGQAVVSDERVPTRIRQGLNVESGLNDGLCVPLLLVALAIAEAEEGATGGGSALTLLAEEIGWGVVGGVVGGLVAVFVVRQAIARRLVAEAWLQVIPLAAAAFSYGLAVALGGSGFIAAFVGGLVFGMFRSTTQDEGAHLIEELGDLLGALTFIVFGAVILGPTVGRLDWQLVVYALLSLTLVRMLPVALALLGTGARATTVAFIGWFGPRGLASIVFAVIILDEADLTSEARVLDAIIVTVGLSVLLHGLTAVPLTNRYTHWYRSHPRPPQMEAGHATHIRWRREAREER